MILASLWLTLQSFLTFITGVDVFVVTLNHKARYGITGDVCQKRRRHLLEFVA